MQSAPFLKTQTLADGRIHIFTLVGTGESLNDAWIEARAAALAASTATRSVLFLNDLRDAGFTFDTLKKSTKHDAERVPPHLYGYVANIVRTDPIGNLYRLGVRQTQRIVAGNWDIRAFTDYETAVAWLLTCLDAGPPTAL